ncbi:MAG: 6-bladed beta-propeller [Marinifilaceae bacterium]
MVLDTASINKLNHEISNIVYLPLETNKDCIIGEISNIIYTKDYIFILDKMKQCIHQFDKNGKFIKHLGSRGKARNEFMRIRSFFIDEVLSQIGIYCEMKQQILLYDIEHGNFINSKPIGLLLDNIIKHEDQYYFYCGRLPNQDFFKGTFPSQYRLVSLDNDSSFNHYLRTDYNPELLNTSLTSNSESSLYIYHDSVRVMERCNSTILQIFDNNIKNKYYVDFGKLSLNCDFYDNTEIISESLLKRLDNKKYCRLSEFIEIDDYIYLEYLTQNRLLSSIYSKKTNEVFNFGVLWLSPDGIGMPRIINKKDNFLIGVYESENLLRMIGTNKHKLNTSLMNIYNTVQKTDNPILCFVHFD